MGCSASQEDQGQQPSSKSAPSEQQDPHIQQGEKPTGKVLPQIQVNPVKIDKEILARYINLEKEIHQLEGKNVLKAVKVKEDELGELNARAGELQKAHEASAKQTAKEKADVDNLRTPSVRQFLEERGNFDSTFTKEQEEYLEALNKQEIIKKELDGVYRQRDVVTAEVNSLKTEAGKVTERYNEQDELLAGIFAGQYGSELEYHLETQLDMLLDRKQRIGVAKYKWQNGRVLLQHAVLQLGHAVTKWLEVESLRNDSIQIRYTVATECRNSLVAAHQNIANAQRYLSTIQFPYCKQPEMDTLSRATSNIYTDLQTPARHGHALNCYSVTHKRAAALLQWFDHVIDNTIVKDLHKASLNVNTKERELRAERLRLIKQRVKEELGEDVDLTVDGEDQMDSETAVDQQLTVVTAVKDDTKSTDGEQIGAGSDADETKQQVAPLALSELAPPPATDDLFGDIDDLRKQHEQEMEDFKKTQELNKARIDQGLQEKLRARRSRRAREITTDYTDGSQ